jgi:hypothetical protein
MPIYVKQNRIYQNKVRHSLYPIDKSVITNHINISITSKLLNKTPSDRLVYSSQNPYGGVGDAGFWTRNPNCWLNGVTNISCFSPAQRSGANWWQRGGTLITRKHALFAKHFATSIISGGTPLIFVDEYNNAISRKIINYGYDLTDIAIALLDEEVPSNIKIAKVLPPNYTEYFKISGLDDDMILAVGLDQEEKAILKRTSFVFGNYIVPNISVYNLLNTSPYYAFTEDIVVGDSGNPVFLIIDNELVVLTTWWTPSSGPFITTRYDAVNSIINNLSPGEGYGLTPVDLELVYHKYS